jgi:enterochelin esterase-like enzyme
MKQHLVESSSGEYARQVWLLPAPCEPAQKLAIFLDGEYYVNDMKAQSILLKLQKRRTIPPLLCAFVSHLDNDARHRDLTCNSRYAEFIAVDLLGWLREKIPALPECGNLIGGASLGGLAAVHLSLTRPELFPLCLCHSGSFWWNDEWLLKNLGVMPPGQNKFWLSVGDGETESGVTHGSLRQDVDQISANRHLVDALLARGAAVHHHLYKGGHAIKPWKNELPQALTWLLGSKPPSS